LFVRRGLSERTGSWAEATRGTTSGGGRRRLSGYSTGLLFILIGQKFVTDVFIIVLWFKRGF
jgi:hypothetical protein